MSMVAGLRTREWVDATLLLIAVATAVLAAAHVDSTARLVLALVAATFLPGGAVLTWFPVSDPAAWFGLAATISFSLEAIAGSMALWFHVWHPVPLIIAMGVASSLVLAVDLRRCRRDAGTAHA
jgi:uncharacterized membrane protein